MSDDETFENADAGILLSNSQRPFERRSYHLFCYFASSDRPLLHIQIRPANVFEHPEILKSLNGARSTQARELARKCLESSTPIIGPFPAQRVLGASASRAVATVSTANSSDCSEKIGGRRTEGVAFAQRK